MFITSLIGFGLPAIGIGLLAAAGAAFVYVPIIGRYLAVGLVALSAGTFAYDGGYRERGAMDQSAILQSQIETLKSNAVEMQRETDASSRIAKAANAAELAAITNASENQEKVTKYEAELAKRPPNGLCDFSDDDISGLQSIGSAPGRSDTPKPAGRPLDIRPPRQSADAP